MSVHRIERKSGAVYKSAWRDEKGRQRSRTFSRKRDADAWDATIKLAKRQGELAALDAGRQTLKEFAAEWWRTYAEQHLAAATLVHYASLRDRLIAPRLGHLQLRALTPDRIQTFHAELAEEGVGKDTRRKTLALLQSMLERAVEWGHIQRNPVRSVRKPAQGRTRVVKPLAPMSVEKLRHSMLRRGSLRDATLVAVLAYAGLRPGEALALRWGDVRERTLVVDKALSFGEEKTTKNRRTRTVRLVAPLVADLAEWRLASGRPAGDALVFPTRDGKPWSDFNFRNWRRRRYAKAAEKVGLTGGVRVYDLRHSFASLLLAEQTNTAEIAGQLGHSLQTLYSTYAHVIEELIGRGRVNAEDEIRAARAVAAAGDVASLLPGDSEAASVGGSAAKKNPA